MIYTCYVCQRTVEPDAAGEIRLEGVTELPKGKAWVWGPEPVHEECRLLLRTPYDHQAGYRLTWQHMKA